jgi:hypothetical protein
MDLDDVGRQKTCLGEKEMMDRDATSREIQAQTHMLSTTMSVWRPFTINGRAWSAQELVPLLVTDPAQLDAHIAVCPAWVAFWGGMVADAKYAHDQRQADYRVARDTWSTRRRAESKATQAAIEEEWRTQPEYPTWQGSLLEVERAWSCAQFLFDAFGRKAQMLTALARVYVEERAASANTRPGPVAQAAWHQPR